MDISVGRVRLVFPLDLGVENLKAIRPNDSIPQRKDTIADVGMIVADVRLMPLLQKKVEIDKLEFEKLKVNTSNFIKNTRVSGVVGRMMVKSHGIDLRRQSLNVNNAIIDDAKVCVALADTAKKDTSKTENYWKINVRKLDVANTEVNVTLPGDTIAIGAYMGKLEARHGFFDLFKQDYKLKQLSLSGGRIVYDNKLKQRVKGLDYNHIAMSGVALALDSFSYVGNVLGVSLKKCALVEKSGFRIDSLAGGVSMDSTSLTLSKLRLSTPESSLNAVVYMDFDAFSERDPGQMYVTLDGWVGKQDIMMFLPDMPNGFRRRWPNYPLQLKGVVRGNMRHASISGVNLKLPTAFNVNAHGWMSNLDNADRLKANIQLNARTADLGFVAALLPPDVSKQVSIPSGISIQGRFEADGSLYNANFTAAEGGGRLAAKASINLKDMAYNAVVDAEQLHIEHFLRNAGLHPFSGFLTAKGRGFDILSKHTLLTAVAKVEKFDYAGYDLSDMNFNAHVADGVGHARLESTNPMLNGNVQIDALMSSKEVKATFGCDLARADFKALRFTSDKLIAALCAHVDIASDLKHRHSIRGIVNDITLIDSVRTYRPKSISADVFTRIDTTHARIATGDFSLALDAGQGYEEIIKSGEKIVAEAMAQRNKRYIDQKRLRALLPLAKIFLDMGKDNMVSRAAKKYGYDLSGASMDMSSSPANGLNGYLEIDSVVTAGIQLDTIRLRLQSDTAKTVFLGKIQNNKKNPQYVFNALFGGTFYERGMYFGAKVVDAKERTGVAIGLNFAMVDDGIRVNIGGANPPILGYKRFNVNKDNYVLLRRDQRISADLKLNSAEGTGVQIYSNDSTEALQDLTVALKQFDLNDVSSVIPYMPKMGGVMNGDFHLIKTSGQLSLSSSISVGNMSYEGCPMGDIASELVYMPREDGSHSVDATLSRNGRDIGLLSGSYRPEGEGSLDAELTLEHTPLSIVNGFIPERLFGLKGYGDGTLSVKGTLSAPDVDGEVLLDSAYLNSEPYGVEMRFANDPVRISNSHLLFENFEMFAHNDSPLNLAGYLDFSDPSRLYLDVRMRADNYLLIDSKENMRSQTYGKAFVNFYGRASGRVESLLLRGRLDVLGSTNMTYILRDSPLTTDNQMDDLVKFVDFKNKSHQAVAKPALTGLTMDLTLSIDQGAHIMCALNADHSNYVDLIGGGDLRLQYNAMDAFRLTGRYTLNNGEMKYSLPVIPLKTFTIQDGSYVEFNGDPMNPKLNITATEETKANVSSGSGNERTVLFQCGVVITKTLKDMGLEFIIDAPEDMSVHNELQTMSVENRGKIAVTMLTTGMYLAGGSTNSFSMNSALTAFLNSQINSISGKALRTLDLSFGMDNTTTETGGTQTDYSFKFAKRFWNNRLRIVVGGKLSTGADVQNQNNTFFDNVTFEYRLSQTSNQYLKLFYERDSYDWLEGNVGKYGGGFIWRRKLRHFKDIFRTSSDRAPVIQMGNDTLNRQRRATADSVKNNKQ